jgi:hypothetical protein
MSIKQFKTYLHSEGLYSGNINNFQDDEFISAIKKLENNISNEIKRINKTAPDNIASGIIWNGASLNTTVEDVKYAFNLIKGAQAKIDTFDMEEFQEHPPVEVKVVPSKEDKAIETGDPAESQQIGLLQETIPKKALNMDDRFLSFSILNAAAKKNYY